MGATLSNGIVYYWPTSNESWTCLLAPTSGCSYIRQQITNVTYSNGYAYFTVGAFAQPAGGYYRLCRRSAFVNVLMFFLVAEVSAGDDVPLIVGITAACVCVVVAVVVSAVCPRYFASALLFILGADLLPQAPRSVGARQSLVCIASCVVLHRLSARLIPQGSEEVPHGAAVVCQPCVGAGRRH